MASNASPVRVPNCLPLSCSEDLFPVGGARVVCSLSRFVQDFYLPPSGTRFVSIRFISLHYVGNPSF